MWLLVQQWELSAHAVAFKVVILKTLALETSNGVTVLSCFSDESFLDATFAITRILDSQIKLWP